MRGFQVIVVVVFGVFAALQYNDPDPWVWMSAYGLVAWGGLRGLRGMPWSRGFLRGLAVGFAMWGWALWPGETEGLTGEMSAERPWVEPAREAIGLWMASAALLALAVGVKAPEEDEV